MTHNGRYTWQVDMENREIGMEKGIKNMMITGFNPVIASNKAEEIVKLFEALSFEKAHNPVVTSEIGTASVTRMRHPNGHHVDVVSPDRAIPQDITRIRINVDDFDEAYKLLTDHGFEIAMVDNIVDIGFAKAAIMVSPSGLMINLVQHIKEHD